jgi:glycosyltransferase involved in cell wall biosynthesis
MKLSIVIPAYNEEQAIAAIIERTLDARPTIIERSPVDDVEIIVVSDGSSDRTVEIAAGYDQVKLIVFEKNQGYGAAIKRGFAESTGELVSFLDADGTCDPVFFAKLCAALVGRKAVIALGSRLGPQSRMPRMRRIGNRLYATMLSVLSNRVVHDTASGMRVIRRDALTRLFPLPDGLHFTPAMSARALMDDELKIVELPMAYEERVGESKLSVWKDGLRFLRVILEMTLIWRPARVFASGAVLCVVVMTLLAMHPIEQWVRERQLQEDVIYRLLFCSLLGMLGMALASAWQLSERLHDLTGDGPRAETLTGTLTARLFSLRGLTCAGIVAAPLLLWLIGPGVWTFVTQGKVFVHWSRVVLAGLITFSLCQLGITTIVLNLIQLHAERMRGRAASAAVIEGSNTPQSDTPLKRRVESEELVTANC